MVNAANASEPVLFTKNKGSDDLTYITYKVKIVDEDTQAPLIFA
jgi:hypothetical protein